MAVNDDLALDKLISRNFDPLMNYTRILYFTKGLGKYKILIPCEGKNYFPLRPKGLKNTFPCGLRPLGNVFLTFGPLGEVIFTLTRDEYFILSRPLGEVYHILKYLANEINEKKILPANNN